MTSELRPAVVDFHSHLVPGVDDGARDMDESLAAVGRMVEAGIEKIITTPHANASLTHDPDGLRSWLAPPLCWSSGPACRSLRGRPK